MPHSHSLPRALSSARRYSATLSLLTATAFVAAAQAQDSGPLVDALVRKGILTTAEAQDIRADLTRDYNQSSAGKINLSNSITELKLYGDLRLRYQYDNKDPQLNAPGVGVDNERELRSPSGSQQSRWRFRLRLNADFKLGRQWFGGVELQTQASSDSGFTTFENGFSDYPIFISRAFLGWSPADSLTVTAGKVPNPFYSTDLIWDADVNPTGITEALHFHKLFAPESVSGSFDGKTAVARKTGELPWELSLVAGQFIFDDNLEGGGSDLSGASRDNDSTSDVYLFQTQFVAGYKFNKTTKLTIAPGWLVNTSGTLSDVNNANSFNDNANVSGASRNLSLLLLPGDIGFNVGPVKARLFWDLAYNVEGRKRSEDIYNLVSLRAPGDDRVTDPDDFDKKHRNRDDIAWLVGVQLGENKKKGNWSLLASYRETGIAGVDPNLNESDFAQSELNTRGIRFGASYNLTDFAVASVTYGWAWNLREDLVGGEATGGNAIADSNDVQVLQVDLNVKF
ncbi:MAG: hypothetical protein JWQ44_1192 [Chthoniobacter sp.]|nr:hypothetical protein [Chthoniobacter sp.]